MLAMMLECMTVAYARFDGRVNSIDERGDIINVFRDEPSCHVLLTSLGAGGEGLNLIFANHVVLMEPYWNCAAEQQAIDRLHRIGQTKVTHVLRLMSKGSIEDWVQVIQRKKTKELERLLCGKECEEESGVRKEVFRVATTAPASAGLAQFLA
jgi:SNF2 family DNA or RNA helicase